MGRTFQVNKTKENEKYIMTEMSDNMLSLTNKYTEFPNYYPSNDPINALPAVQVNSNDECLNRCNNTQGAGCSYFNTYGENDKLFCVTGTQNSRPLFNQNPGENQTNGSLFIRGNQTAQPTIQECIAGKIGNDYSSVKNTIDYTSANPYFNYKISNEKITDFKQIGDCNNPAVADAIDQYAAREKEAKDILSNIKNYRADGYYENNLSPGVFSKPKYSESQPGCEPFDTRLTDATLDTQSNINKLHSIQQSVQQKEDLIKQNKQKISGTLLPDFMKTRATLKSDNKYDYNGDVLLYLRDTKIPSKDEQRLIDSSDEKFTQGSIYSLGIITAATLIILAIYLGRE